MTVSCNYNIVRMKVTMSQFTMFSVLIVILFQSSMQLSLPSSTFGRSQVSYPRNNNASDGAKYEYKIKTFEVPVDHFSFAVKNTFKIRYLMNDTWQKTSNGPIFFYTGNEGSIEIFAKNTGFMWEIAPLFGALLIFAEHRYYGESMPFGNNSYSDPQHLGYLTSQQAMADYVDLIEYLRSLPNNKDSPVIAFGGSYGGMLSAWIRMKYPNIVQGAIAASAPILQFTGVTSCNAFSRIVTADFREAHPECPNIIRKSWSTIANITATDEGKKWLSKTWKLCEPLKNTTHIKAFTSYLEDIYGNLAMVNYPYKANFLAPLPAQPIVAVCKHLTNSSLSGKPLLIALHKAISVYTNFTGKATCLATKDAAPDLEARGWPYQACTEMVMPMCTDGINDMFEPEPWNLKKISDECMKKFSVEPLPYSVCKQYGCTDLSTATNIVFSNGLLDPWSSGGVLRNLSSSTVAVIIPEGAHHLDLRASNDDDPYSVILARKYHRYAIRRWITEYHRSERKSIVL